MPHHVAVRVNPGGLQVSGNHDDGVRIGRPDFGTDLLERPKAKREPKHPSMYKVFIHNDDYTPFEFVLLVLEKIFSKDEQAATTIMLEAHKGGPNGLALVGVYTYEIAETKLAQASDFCRNHQQALRFSMEKDS